MLVWLPLFLLLNRTMWLIRLWGLGAKASRLDDSMSFGIAITIIYVVVVGLVRICCGT